MSTTIRVDTGQPYHTQRNNNIRAHRTCASTAMAMALRYAGYERQLALAAEDMQYEDFITDFIHTDPRVIKFWQFNRASWIRNSYKNYEKWEAGKLHERHVLFGNEIHDVMAFAMNTLLEKTVVVFNDQTPIPDILWNLMRGGSATLSGTFPFNNTILHHIVALAGFQTQQEELHSIAGPDELDISLVENFIIDDPYGDYTTRYKSHSGNDVIMPLSDVYDILKESGNTQVKRAHIVRPRVQTPRGLFPRLNF